MMRTLHGRLVLSHVASILLITPLVGIFLIYLIETQVVYADLTAELQTQGRLLAELTKKQPDFWTNPASAQALAASQAVPVNERVMYLQPDGHVLAINKPDDLLQPGGALQVSSLSSIASGQPLVRTGYDSFGLHSEVVEVLIPVEADRHQLVGVIRLTHGMDDVMGIIVRIRYIVAGVLLFAVLIEVLIAWALAISLRQPLTRVTDAVYAITRGGPIEPLREQGPAEIQLLVRGVNYLVERLQVLDRMRRELRANLVHELRRPVGALRSATHALQNGAAQDPALSAELLAGMDRQLEVMESLLADLARLHDLLVGTVELKLETVNSADWLCLVLGPWREAARAKSLQWQESWPSDLSVVTIDSMRMSQALENIVSNAIKYTPAGGTVTVTAGCDDHVLWIRISDTGPGIQPEERSFIFKPFYQASQGQASREGMGLGLSIAQDIVRVHGGELVLESTPGAGSHFTIRLYAAAKADLMASAASPIRASS